ncbi:MAG: HAD family hydrolase [Patescibacteria group bacterium]
MIKLVIFDLWKTLAYRKVPYSTTRKILQITNSPIPHKEFVKIFERSLQLKPWRSEYLAYANLCQAAGLPLEPTLVTKVMNIRKAAESRTKLYSYSISLLRQLNNLGYKTALLSNSTIFNVRVLKKKTNLLKYIDYPLFSYQVGAIKPSLIFFKALLKKTNYKPSQCLMIGDKIEDDVLAPRKLGINSILFESYNQLKKELINYSIIIR